MALIVGDVVRAKMGGPRMTVHWIENHSSPAERTVECIWFDGSNHLQRGGFKEAELTTAE